MASRESDFSSFYSERLAQADEKARASIAKYQNSEDPLIDPVLDPQKLAGAEFPKTSLERIRDSNMADDEKLRVLTYLLGAWVVDNSGGQWAYVPMLVGLPELFIKHSLGVQIYEGMLWNAVDSAQGVINGDDLDFKEAMLNSDFERKSNRQHEQ